MVASIINCVGKGCVFSLVLAGAFSSAQQRTFDGTWQMDAAQSKMNDSRVVTLTIATPEAGIKMRINTRKGDGQETTSEFTSKLDGKPCEFVEGSHKSQITIWYNGPTLNASKEGGPVEDVTSGWKLELGPHGETMTMTINHYEPAGADETVVFTKKHSGT
jgi:hypothetical protein